MKDLEPATQNDEMRGTEYGVLYSIAVSLKRIADAMERDLEKERYIIGALSEPG